MSDTNFCQRLPSTATKADIAFEHRDKMRQKRTDRRYAEPSRPTPPARANLSRRHPDFGLSPAEHTRRKARFAVLVEGRDDPGHAP